MSVQCTRGRVRPRPCPPPHACPAALARTAAANESLRRHTAVNVHSPDKNIRTHITRYTYAHTFAAPTSRRAESRRGEARRSEATSGAERTGAEQSAAERSGEPWGRCRAERSGAERSSAERRGAGRSGAERSERGAGGTPLAEVERGLHKILEKPSQAADPWDPPFSPFNFTRDSFPRLTDKALGHGPLVLLGLPYTVLGRGKFHFM